MKAYNESIQKIGLSHLLSFICMSKGGSLIDDLKIRYSIKIEKDTVSFDNIEEICKHPFAQQIEEKILFWEEKLKKAVIQHLLSKEIGKENTKLIHISFHKMKES